MCNIFIEMNTYSIQYYHSKNKPWYQINIIHHIIDYKIIKSILYQVINQYYLM